MRIFKNTLLKPGSKPKGGAFAHFTLYPDFTADSPAPVHAGCVVRVVFVENGAAMISAGKDGAVHRIGL